MAKNKSLFEDVVQYFSSSDTQIYINNILATEVESIQFSYSSSHVPFYGYRSLVFDAAPLSRVAVQGSITLNYVGNAYLTGLLAGDIVENFVNKDNKDKSAVQFVNSEDFLQMTDTQLKLLRDDSRETIDTHRELFNDVLSKSRPEMTLGPVDIKIVDNTRFAERQTDIYRTTFEDNPHHQIQTLKGVYIDTMNSVRSVQNGVVKYLYTFIAKTII